MVQPERPSLQTPAAMVVILVLNKQVMEQELPRMEEEESPLEGEPMFLVDFTLMDAEIACDVSSH